MKNTKKDFPQLIIALDSLDNTANYIHIDDVKENTNYYCPCCKGLVKPRAYKKDVDYQVQPHFYHENGGCNEETYIHYICKNWLFNKGCEFVVNGVKYEVDTVEIEKTLHTSFGDYRPDIVVTTTVGKVFYFEIKVTNKKTEHHIPKWDELGNDVVEVDTRYFINQKYKNNIPEFNLIYSDGQCFVKKYSLSDYEDTIAKRKIEWKRQDKLNYKIQWERLDWFWIGMQEYAKGEYSAEKVLEVFNELDYSDKLWVYYSIKKKTCVDLKTLFKENINQHFMDMIHSLEDDKIKIAVKHVSPKIYEVCCRANFAYLDYKLFEEEIVRVKVQSGDILSLECEDEIKNSISKLNDYIRQGNSLLKRIDNISSLPYVKSIVPYSHWAAETYSLHTLWFEIEFIDNIRSREIKEFIGKERVQSNMLYTYHIQDLLRKYKKNAITNLDNDFIKFALKNNSKYQNLISELQAFCNNTDHLKIKVSSDFRRITLLDGYSCIYEYEYTKQDQFGLFEDKLKHDFLLNINESFKKRNLINEYVTSINSCSNKLWKATYYKDSLLLDLYDPQFEKQIDHANISFSPTLLVSYDSNDIKKDITEGMNDLLKHAENYHGIRFLKEK